MVDCAKLIPTPLNNKNIKIRAADGAIKAGGIFSSSYLHYKIYTETLGWTVLRKDADFYFLRK